MRFKTGDKVKFLNESGGGIISEVIDEKAVKVMTEDGFEIPVFVRELIKYSIDADYESINRSTTEKVKQKEREKPVNRDFEALLPENVAGNASKIIAIGLVPADQENTGISELSLYLINDSAYGLFYLTGIQENATWKYLRSGYLEADTKIFITTFNQSDISKIKCIHFQALMIGKGKYHPQTPIDRYLQLGDVRFYKENTYKENEYFDEKAFILDVTGNITERIDQHIADHIAEAMMQKKIESEKPIKAASNNKDIPEVDLHIEKISENYAGMSAGEILNLQMNKFFSALDDGILNRKQRIVFIHGIGNGKLKYEILKALDEKYPDLRYQDASFKEYGYGATMVYLI